MNKKLNFVWKNIDKPFCQDFKAKLDGQFKSVRQAYDAAGLINQSYNPDYKSSKATSTGYKQRIKTSTASTYSNVSNV